MTIVVGFPGRDFVVLAADSEEIGGLTKGSVRKLAYLDRSPTCSCIIGGAGDGDFIDLAVQEMAESIPPDRQLSLKQLRSLLESVVSNIYTSRIDKLPTQQQRSEADFELLCALWSQGEGVQLVKVTRSAALIKRTPEAIGIGTYLSRYLIANLALPHMDMRASQRLGTYVISQCKTHAAYCGGTTQLNWIGSDGIAYFQYDHIRNWDETAMRVWMRGSSALFHRLDPASWGFDLSQVNAGVDEEVALLKVDISNTFGQLAQGDSQTNVPITETATSDKSDDVTPPLPPAPEG